MKTGNSVLPPLILAICYAGCAISLEMQLIIKEENAVLVSVYSKFFLNIFTCRMIVCLSLHHFPKNQFINNSLIMQTD